jgi:Protein of unknown function (DUF4197)
MIQKITILFFVTLLSLLPHVSWAGTDWWATARQVLAPENTKTGAPVALTNRDIAAALRDALQIGSARVVKQLGRPDGFNLDSQIHIPLPKTLQTVDKMLGRVGMSSLTDDLELRLNRAAETATPRAKELFISAIKQMTFADARTILTGPNDAATTYLRRTMGKELARDMTPIVREALSQVEAVATYEQVMARYNAVPLAPKIDADLNAYVVDRALDGIFYYVAREESLIREDPARQTTALLRRVFGGMIAR